MTTVIIGSKENKSIIFIFKIKISVQKSVYFEGILNKENSKIKANSHPNIQILLILVSKTLFI